MQTEREAQLKVLDQLENSILVCNEYLREPGHPPAVREDVTGILWALSQAADNVESVRTPATGCRAV